LYFDVKAKWKIHKFELMMHHTNEDFKSSLFPERIASLTATIAFLMSLSLLSMICLLSVSTKGKTVQYKNSTTKEALL